MQTLYTQEAYFLHVLCFPQVPTLPSLALGSQEYILVALSVLGFLHDRSNVTAKPLMGPVCLFLGLDWLRALLLSGGAGWE